MIARARSLRPGARGGPGVRAARRGVAAASIGVSVLALLVGCAGGAGSAPPSADDPPAASPGAGDLVARSYAGLPEGVEAPSGGGASPAPLDPGATPDPSAIPEPDFAPFGVWLDAETLAIVTFGSSSCPAAPTALERGEGDAVDVTLEPTGGEVCTADIAPTTFEIDEPTGIDPGERSTLRFPDGSTAVLEPAA